MKKCTYCFKKITEEYQQNDDNFKTVFSYAVLSEVWARLSSLFLCNGCTIYEFEAIKEMKDSYNPVYYAAYKFLENETCFFDIDKTTFEEKIQDIKTNCLSSLFSIVTWMRTKFNHNAKESWMPVVVAMEREYQKGGVGHKELSEIYCPSLE